MEYISLPRKKILVLAGFEQLPVEAKISKVHALPSELAGPGLMPKSTFIYTLLQMLNHPPVEIKMSTIKVLTEGRSPSILASLIGLNSFTAKYLSTQTLLHNNPILTLKRVFLSCECTCIESYLIIEQLFRQDDFNKNIN